MNFEKWKKSKWSSRALWLSITSQVLGLLVTLGIMSKANADMSLYVAVFLSNILVTAGILTNPSAGQGYKDENNMSL